MMMSMYSAVSGLKAQQTKLNVIGNNIANINTVGSKSQKVGFGDLLSQTVSNASAGSGGMGGTNAKQIGLGTQVSSVEMVMTTGSSQYTGSDMDVALSGDGFFVVKGGTQGDFQYTRAGNFGVDEAGNLVVNGMKVCGLPYDAKTKTYGSIGGLSFAGKSSMAAATTTVASLEGNLDKSKSTVASPATVSTTLTIFDSNGDPHDTTVTFTHDPAITTAPTWNVTVSIPAAEGSVSCSVASVAFDPITGAMTTTPTSLPLVYAISSGAQVVDSTNTLNVEIGNIFGFASATGKSSIEVSDVDGYAGGKLQDFSIGADGVITGSYNNGQKQPLGKLQVATFTNPSGMEKIGDNLYVPSVNAGTKAVTDPGVGNAAKLTTGALEMSNVDLANEFSEMMITQRAYQANSKIITTSDTLMETLINMSR